MDKDWNPIFYVVFIPILLGALYFIVCMIGGLCSKQARQAQADMRREIEEAAALQKAATARKRITYSGPDFRRGARSQPHHP